MAGQLSWLERMIHNHEVPGSIPGPATKNDLAVGWLPRLAVFLMKMAGQLSWLERMIHNHEVPGSIPGPATKKTFKSNILDVFFCVGFGDNLAQCKISWGST